MRVVGAKLSAWSSAVEIEGTTHRSVEPAQGDRFGEVRDCAARFFVDR